MCLKNRSLILPEILHEPPGLRARVQQVRRAFVVPLAHRGARALGPVPHHGRLGLQEERQLRRHAQQGHQRPEHLQAILLKAKNETINVAWEMAGVGSNQNLIRHMLRWKWVNLGQKL